jgi:hypothetical protein
VFVGTITETPKIRINTIAPDSAPIINARRLLFLVAGIVFPP